MQELVVATALALPLPVVPAVPAPPACLPVPPCLPLPPCRAQKRPSVPAAGSRPARSARSRQWQKPEQIMDALGIAEGSVVADLGAGGGWFTLRLARRVGPNGLVYAEDIQPPMLEAISRRMQSENLSNVRPVLGTPSDPRLPQGLDAVADRRRVSRDGRPGGSARWWSRCCATSRGAEAAGPPGHRRFNAGRRRTRTGRRISASIRSGDPGGRRRRDCS